MAAKVVINPDTNVGALLVNGQMVRQFRVATGDTTGILYGEKFFTPTGKFKFLSKEATTDTYHPYWMQFDVAENGDAYGLHGPYDQEAFVFPEHEPTKNKGFVSHGCIRVPKKDLSAIAKYLEVGSEIEVLPYRKPGQETAGTKTTYQGISPDIGEIRAKPLPARMTSAVYGREYPVYQLEPKKSHVLAVTAPKEDPHVVDAIDIDILSRKTRAQTPSSNLSERKSHVLAERAPEREDIAPVATLSPQARFGPTDTPRAMQERKSHVLDRTQPQPERPAGDVAYGTFSPRGMQTPSISPATEATGPDRPERFTWAMARNMGLSANALNKAQVTPFMDIDEVVNRLNAAGVRPESV